VLPFQEQFRREKSLWDNYNKGQSIILIIRNLAKLPSLHKVGPTTKREAIMSETTEKQAGYFGTYFDRDSILRISRWAEIIAWVTLTVYVLNWVNDLPQYPEFLLTLLVAAVARRLLFLWLDDHL
jgi:hypothetical protein